MDVPTVHKRYVDGRPALDLCSDNNGGGVADNEHGHMMNKRVWIAAVIIVAAIVIGNLGGLWLASTFW